MKKTLHIIEYYPFSSLFSRIKESKNSYVYNNRIFDSFITVEDKYNIQENINTEQYNTINNNLTSIYNDMKMEEKEIPLDNVLIFDDIIEVEKDDNNSFIDLYYILSCPICNNTIIINSSYNEDGCIQCGNTTFPFDFLGIINRKQLEELMFNNKDVTTLILRKNNKVVFVDEKQ